MARHQAELRAGVDDRLRDGCRATLAGAPTILRDSGQPQTPGQSRGVKDIGACHAAIGQLHHIPPGNPMENGHSESFNGTFRDECLNQRWFLDLNDAQQLIESWRTDDSTNRPHSGLRNLRLSSARPTAYLPLPAIDVVSVLSR